MKFLPVTSSLLVSIGYNLDTRNLVAQFDSDTYYLYPEVPPAAVTSVVFAKSIGQAFTRVIKNGPYDFSRVSVDEAQEL